MNFYMDCHGLVYLPAGEERSDKIWTESKEGEVSSSVLRNAKYIELKNGMYLVLVEMVDMMDGEEYFVPVRWNNKLSCLEVGESTEWYYSVLKKNEINL